MTHEADFAQRHAAFVDEARTIKAEVLADLAPVLAQADAILTRLSAAGIAYRIQLPITHAITDLSGLRVLASFHVEL